MAETILKNEERIAYALRALYQRYGYRSYKMSKFEEYDLYVQNKDFLVGDGVITFNDTDGKLLALKPDVTLSIIKNDGDVAGKRKVSYHENVYRISDKTKQFKEIMQTGLECIGDIDAYDVYETLYLAAGSLAEISKNFVLDISHAGIVSAVLARINKGEKFSKEAMQKIAEKNTHDLQALCDKYQVSTADKEKLLVLVSAYGAPKKVLEKLSSICNYVDEQKALNALKTLCDMLGKTEYEKNIRIDFSVINDMNYYDDIVFKGFVDGIGAGVLSGGRYDKMLSRMGRKSGGIGFAVYLDGLETFQKEKRDTDVDVLVLYDENTDLNDLANRVKAYANTGKSVSAQKTKEGLRYAEMIDITGGSK